jgi:hypothetical protein
MTSVRVDPVALNKHQLSAPFTGAVYDLLCEIFFDHHVDAGAVTRELAEACHHDPARPVADLKRPFGLALRGRRPAFVEALQQARDDVANLLAGAWRRSTTDGLVFGKVVTHMLAADAELGLGRGALIRDTFALRGIAPVPAVARAS